MINVTPVTASIGGECFLLTTPKSAVLLDTGFDFCADTVAANIQTILGDRPLDLILGTHSHYDHMSGAGRIKRRYPAARVVASRYAEKVFNSNGAKTVMRQLNAACAEDVGVPVGNDGIDDISVDVPVEDGDVVTLDDMTIQAVATPGHTRCAMSYFFQEESLLACSETLGIAPTYPEVIPCFIVSCRSTLDSIERCRAVGAKKVFVSHRGILPESESATFFDHARAAVEKAAKLLLDLHDRGCGEEAIVEAFTEAFYWPTAELQPRRAFELNTRALIPRVLEEFGRTPRKSA